MPTIDEKYNSLHPGSFSLHQRARSLFPDGVTHDVRWFEPFPIAATHGVGARKWDVDNNEYVDYVMGHGALLLGHSHRAIVEAVSAQVTKGTHLGASHRLEVEWADWVTKLIPSAEKVRFTSSGTEATMMALRLARAYTGKDKIIKFDEHFHGWHDYVLAGAGQATAGIPSSTWDSMIVLKANDIRAVEETLIKNRNVAGIILEPTGAHMGFLPLQMSFLSELREITRRYETVLIFDEVVTGFRTSPGGAQSLYGVMPDLTTLAKILGGGLPAGAVAGKSEILEMIQHRNDPSWDTLQRISHPGTFNANPLSAAAGIVALEMVSNTKLNLHADMMASRLKDGLNHLLGTMEIPGCASGVASLVHLTLGVNHECEGSICNLGHDEINKAMSPWQSAALKAGLLNAGVDTMRGRTFIVSAAHQENDIDVTVDACEEALNGMLSEGLI